MITACVAISDNNTSCLQYLLRSMEKKMSLISEILIADFNYRGLAQDWEFELGGVPVAQFKYNYPITNCYCHAVGLHQCIRRAKNDYLMFLDHDVIMLMKGFDQFFMHTLCSYDLSIVGLEHYKSVKHQAFLDFPTVIAALVKRTSLPGPDWLAGELKYRNSIAVVGNDPADNYPIQHDNFWMIQTPIPGRAPQFPNPNGNFDTGCNFWIWVEQQKGRWLSFKKVKSGGPAFYTTGNANNFGLVDDFGNRMLMFHCGLTGERQAILHREMDKSLALDQK